MNQSKEKRDPQKGFFEYEDYRELLKALYVQNKERNHKFSYRYFARIAGFGSASFLKRVIDGESKLSDESIEKIAKGFKFNKEEGHFFKHLVLLNQAATTEEKQIHARELLRSRSYRKIHPLRGIEYNLYSQWHLIPVRELVGLPGFKEDPQWIAKMVTPSITAEQAKRSLEQLQKLGLLSRDEHGRLVPTSAHLSTSDEVISSSVAQWHKEMMQRASESIDRIPREERDISSVTIKMTKENIKKAKELIQSFRKEMVGLLSGDNPDVVYQLNLQLFPVSENLK